MGSQHYVPPGPDPGQCGCDRDVFLRVWNRVMPEEREGCPITVERPEPTSQIVPRPYPTPQLLPVPERDTQIMGQDSPSDDFPSHDDVPCLGRDGMDEKEQLQEFIRREMAQSCAYQMLSRRGGQGGRMLSALAGNCRRRARRLGTALFLLSGIRFRPAEPSVALPRSYFGALREHFLSEQERGGAYQAAAADCRDMCLQALYLDLADECADHAGRIRTLIENS